MKLCGRLCDGDGLPAWIPVPDPTEPTPCTKHPCGQPLAPGICGMCTDYAPATAQDPAIQAARLDHLLAAINEIRKANTRHKAQSILAAVRADFASLTAQRVVGQGACEMGDNCAVLAESQRKERLLVLTWNYVVSYGEPFPVGVKDAIRKELEAAGRLDRGGPKYCGDYLATIDGDAR